MLLNDTAPISSARAEDSCAAAEEEVLVNFEELLIPEVVLIKYQYIVCRSGCVAILTRSKMSVVISSDVTPPVRSSRPSPPKPPSIQA